MMYEKACLFNDEGSAKKILSAKSPGDAKEYGRAVVGFDQAIWDENRVDIVRKGNLEKFTQNTLLGNFLIGTGNAVLVEANPMDRIWGIGLPESSKDCGSPQLWRGLNLLGFVLMDIRDEILHKQDA